MERSDSIGGEDVDGASHSARTIRLAAVVVGTLLIAGLAAVPIAGAPNYRAYSLFYDQFARIEPPMVLLSLAFIATFAWRASPRFSDEELNRDELIPGSIPPVAIAAAIAIVIWIGVRFVFHGYAFTDDEYSARLQADIFAHGKASVGVPAAWCPWIDAITPTSIATPGCRWRLAFLPLHSLFRAPFVALGIDEVGGAATAVASFFLVISIARKAWPRRPQIALLAGIFFATSTQMLFMSMTFFSMPTHLLLSLLWLWLYVDNRRWSLVLLPWVGVLALGVHSPAPHGFFAAAFLLRLVRERRFALSAYVAAVYVLGILFWLGYLDAAGSAARNAPALASVSRTAGIASRLYALPTPELQLAAVIHLVLAVTWNSPIVVVLAVVAMLSWKRLDTFGRDLSLSIIVILLARIFLSHTPQGVGWGYRYMHDGLGSLTILAALGAERLTEAVGTLSARRWIIAATVLSLVQIPVRAFNVEQIVGPYRRGSDWLASLDYDAVAFPPDVVEWGRQLIRNDPFFGRRPVIIDEARMTRPRLDSLRATGRTVKVVTPDELRAHGLPMRALAIGRIVIPVE